MLGLGIAFRLIANEGVDVEEIGEVIGMGGSDLSSISRGRDVCRVLGGSTGGTRIAPCLAS